MTTIAFFRRFHGTNEKPGYTFGYLGCAVQLAEGWKFIPLVSGKSTSRKFHATWEKCLPRWVGYPDSCESVPLDGIDLQQAYRLCQRRTS